MCNPMLIATAVMTAGSAYANNKATKKVQKARDNATASERIRQKGLDEQIAAKQNSSQDRLLDFQGEQSERATSLGEMYSEASQPDETVGGMNISTTSALPSSTSNIVNSERTKQLSKQSEFSDQQSAALGDLRAFGDVLGRTNLEQAKDFGQIGSLNGFKKGSAGVLPAELAAANSKGDSMRQLGDLLSAGASITGAAAGANNAASAAAGGDTLFTTNNPVFGPTQPGASNMWRTSKITGAPVTFGSIY